MARLRVPTLGWLTAILLSLITLSVFAFLQNSGPTSVVRRFHEAAAKLDRNAAAELVEPNFDSVPTQELWVNVASLMSNGSTDYRLGHSQIESRAAVVVVQYRLPTGQQRSLIWALSKVGPSWRINTRNTTMAARRLLLPRR